ncbi:hypothetical protein D3C86_1016260 [compost metagenome]
MIRLSGSLFLTTQKNILLFVLFLFFSFHSVSQQKKFDRKQFKQEIQQLREEMIVDISKASETLHALEKKYQHFHNAEINYSLTIKKIRFFNAYGDYARVKFEINKAKRFQFFFRVKKQDKLYLDLYSAVYESMGQNDDLLIHTAKSVLRESQKSDIYLLFQCRLILANCYTEKGDFEKAISQIRTAKKLAAKMSAPYHFQVANSAGQVYFFHSRIPEALREFQFAKQLSRYNKWKEKSIYIPISWIWQKPISTRF